MTRPNKSCRGRGTDLIPLQEPYSEQGHRVSGAGQLNTASLTLAERQSLVDWVLLELRAADKPVQILESRVAILRNSGELMDPISGGTVLNFPNHVAGYYHLAVRHRNHLGVMTRQPILLSGEVRSVDFSDPATPVWGENSRVKFMGRSLLWGGDINRDGRIVAAGIANDSTQALTTVLMDTGNVGLSANYIARGYQNADINMDTKITAVGIDNDSNVIRNNILMHPGNKTLNMNYIVRQQLP